jgi:type I restriction enzyme S subunit
MVVPNGWEQKRIEDFPATVVSGGTPSTFVLEYWNGNIPWMNSGELNLKRVHSVEGRITLAGLNNSSTCKVPTNSVLIGLAGQGKTRGTVAITYLELCTNQSIASILPNPEVYNSEFLYQNLDNRYNELRELSTGDGGRGGLNLTNIRRLNVLFPPLPEQCRIAAVLSDTDTLIAALEKLIAKKRAIKQGTMQELLTGKRRLPGFSGEWVEKPLGEIGIITGSGVDKKINADEESVTLLNYLDVYRHTYIKRNMLCHVVTAKNDKVTQCNVLEGDIFFTPTSETADDIAKTAVAIEDMKGVVYSYHVVRLRPYEEYNGKFIKYACDTSLFAKQATRMADGSGTRYVISLPNFREQLIIQTPPTISEQTAIASILSDMDAEIDSLTAKLNKLKHIKQGMMSELLTGRIRLVEAESIAVAQQKDKIIQFEPKELEKQPITELLQPVAKKHNQAIEDAVILAVVTDLFATQQYPLAPFYAQKFPYLLHRHIEGIAEGYHKLAAGPYNPKLKYETALPIAKRNKYVVAKKAVYKGNSYEELLVGEKVELAKNYFLQWHGDEPLKWLEQFRYIKSRRDELELLTTVDMAIVELLDNKMPITISAVKEIIEKSKEWKAKLKRELFSDENISRAIKWSNDLFGGIDNV